MAVLLAGWIYLASLVAIWAAIGLSILARREREPWLSVLEPIIFPSPAPLVSIVVPCRNEERNVAPCLASLLAQRYPHLELIAVDDESRDATAAEIAEFASRDARVTALAGRPLPPGWTGKNHAIHQAMGCARGEWLLFTDADTRHHPDALTRAVGEAVRQGYDLLSLVSRQEYITFWEKVLHPVVLGFLGWRFSIKDINDEAHPAAAANGQYILVRRGPYEKVGGHERIKGTLVEDVELARSFKGAGYRICVAMAMELFVTRMYASLSEMWEGWSKNFFFICGNSLAVTLRTILGFLLVGIAPAALWVVLLAAVVRGPASDGAVALFAGTSSVLAGLWITKMLVYRRFGFSPRYALLDVLGYCVGIGILINSAYRWRLARTTAWKGRSYRQ